MISRNCLGYERGVKLTFHSALPQELIGRADT
jgi:hypothetical protein